jgi:hypothetical protein
VALQEWRPGFEKVKCRELMADIVRFQERLGADPVCLYVKEVAGNLHLQLE